MTTPTLIPRIFTALLFDCDLAHGPSFGIDRPNQLAVRTLQTFHTGGQGRRQGRSMRVDRLVLMRGECGGDLL